MRHYLKHRNEEYIILGHTPTDNTVLIVRMAALSVDDATDLRAIVNTPESQNSWYMAERLPHIKHRVGQDWWTYLMYQIHNSRGKIGTSLPLTQVQDGMYDQEQKAVFKGYGKVSAHPVSVPAPTNEAFAPSPASRHSYDEYAPAAVVEDYHMPSPPAPVSAGIDLKVDMLTQTIVEEGRATRELLTALINKMGTSEGGRERRPRRERAERTK